VTRASMTNTTPGRGRRRASSTNKTSKPVARHQLPSRDGWRCPEHSWPPRAEILRGAHFRAAHNRAPTPNEARRAPQARRIGISEGVGLVKAVVSVSRFLWLGDGTSLVGSERARRMPCAEAAASWSMLNTTTLDSTASLARAQTTEPSPPRPQSQHGIRDEPLTRPRSFRDAVLWSSISRGD
jgi:hypothetical protein